VDFGGALSGRRAQKLPTQCDRVKKARAGAFNMLVFGEIAYALNCRYLDHSSCTMKQFTENMWAWVAIGVTSVLQIFLTYTPGVQDVFSNSNIDGELWGIILGCMVACFIAIDIEKTFAPRYLMPIIRQAGFCLPTPDEEGFRQEAEQGPMRMIATNASVTGMPSSRQGSRDNSRSEFPSGLSHPVSRNRPDDVLFERKESLRRGSFSRTPSGKEMSRV